ncbi:MAG: SdpI family protein [Corynebacterium casei]|nr:SdpI family protein [Corynebacterium casei]MDN6445308.1 SdpI family protein [Corynebacterium casei]MDN6740793.1 SdpI family protein [Corynebacterium casei]
MNSWIGLRTPKLMANEDTWVLGHKAAAGYLMLAGAAFTIGGILFMIIDESLIAFVSLPILAILLITTVLATKKANAAAEQYRTTKALEA